MLYFQLDLVQRENKACLESHTRPVENITWYIYNNILFSKFSCDHIENVSCIFRRLYVHRPKELYFLCILGSYPFMKKIL